VVIDRNQWSEVWKRFRSGDRYAFSEIYEEFADALFAYGSKITSDRELVKDSIQDVFYNLYQYNIKLNRPEYLEFYLFRSVKNDILRKIKNNFQEASLTDDGLFQFDLKFQAEQDIHELESSQQRVEAIQKILQTIDPQKREILFLKFSTGLNYTEIGQIVNMNPDAVKKQVYRTLDILRDKFGDQLLALLMISVKN
jgi:RNA polymerase sigma-70 factor (ECF subfamily)